MKWAIVLLAAVMLLSPTLGLAGEAQNAGGAVDAATTVKSGKSNADNRVGAGAGAGAEAGTSVKSSGSNSDNRVGAGGTGVGGGAERGTTVKSGKSNSSE